MNTSTIYDITSKMINYDLSSDILKMYQENKPIIICLGTDKVLSDMVGVFVADILKSRNISTYVFGGSKICVDKNNIKYILEKFNSHNILIVDSALLNCKNIIYFSNKTKLNNGEVFNIPSIIASTVFFIDNKMLYSHIRFKQVKLFANIIANSILDYFSYLDILNINNKN